MDKSQQKVEMLPALVLGVRRGRVRMISAHRLNDELVEQSQFKAEAS